MKRVTAFAILLGAALLVCGQADRGPTDQVGEEAPGTPTDALNAIRGGDVRKTLSSMSNEVSFHDLRQVVFRKRDHGADFARREGPYYAYLFDTASARRVNILSEKRAEVSMREAFSGPGKVGMIDNRNKGVGILILRKTFGASDYDITFRCSHEKRCLIVKFYVDEKAPFPLTDEWAN